LLTYASSSISENRRCLQPTAEDIDTVHSQSQQTIKSLS
jgi:hypothetical protein